VVLSCGGAANDFALVDVHGELEDDLRAGLYQFGGPTGIQAADEVASFDRVASFGNSSLRPGPDVLDRHHGLVQDRVGPYTVRANFDNPGIPGDSGSPVLTEDGRALGVLVTLGPTGNGVALLEPMLAFAEREGDVGELALVTSPLATPLFADVPSPAS
jgi:hypothetical protein